MTYHVEKNIDAIGKENVLNYIFSEGPTQIDLHKFLKLSNSENRLSASVYYRIYDYLGIDSLPYPKIKQVVRKFLLQYDKQKDYWNNTYITAMLEDRLNNPTYNYADGSIRCVVSFPNHPKSNVDSGQVKAHIVAWELYNKQYVPENCWIVPEDGDYTNLLPENLKCVSAAEYKSKSKRGENNPAFKHGQCLRPKLGGWTKFRNDFIKQNNNCAECGTEENLVVHHIINYHLFNNPAEAHQLINLITLCQHCHGTLHACNNSIKVLIEATQYEKLLELLETLKSQVPYHLMGTLNDVEKQLGLTDNQQLSH
jgi:hypothetical protein